MQGLGEPGSEAPGGHQMTGGCAIGDTSTPRPDTSGLGDRARVACFDLVCRHIGVDQQDAHVDDPLESQQRGGEPPADTRFGSSNATDV